MKSFFWYVYLVLGFFLTISKLWALRRQKGKISEEAYRRKAYDIAMAFGLCHVKATGSTITVKGHENVPKEGAVLFVANHQSNFDIGIMLGYIQKEKGFISKEELAKVPILSHWMQEINCVFMDRSDMKKSLKAITDAITHLKNGYSMVIFPEGTRNKGGETKEFKAGSFKPATKAGVPIVPVTIDGSYRIMEANDNRIKGAEVTLTIHPAIPTAELSREETAALPERVRDIIVKGLA